MSDHDETREAGPVGPKTKAPETERNLKKDSILPSSTRLSDDESSDEEDEDYEDEGEDGEDGDRDDTEVRKPRAPSLNKPLSPCPLKVLSTPKSASLMFIYSALPVSLVCHTAITCLLLR